MESEKESPFVSGKLKHKDDRWLLVTKGQDQFSKRPDSVAGSTQRYYVLMAYSVKCMA